MTNEASRRNPPSAFRANACQDEDLEILESFDHVNKVSSEYQGADTNSLTTW
jgi:hypothetical protein